MKICIQCGLPMKSKVIHKAKKGSRRGSIERYICEHGHEESNEWSGDRFANDRLDQLTKESLNNQKKKIESFDTPNYGEPETEF